MTEREYRIKIANKAAEEALANARAALERALREIDRYNDRMNEAKSLRDKADVMNWTLNYLANGIVPNLGFDAIAKAQAELVRADMIE